MAFRTNWLAKRGNGFINTPAALILGLLSSLLPHMDGHTTNFIPSIVLLLYSFDENSLDHIN